MSTPAAHEAYPANHPRALVWLDFALAISAGMLLSLAKASFFPWLNGYLNARFPGLLLHGGALLAGGLAGLLTLARLAAGLRAATARWLTRWLVLLACAAAPLLLVPARDPMDGFSDGFARWAERFDVDAILRWRDTMDLSKMQPSCSDGYWPVEDQLAPFGVVIPRTSQPAAIADLAPAEVRILPHVKAVVLAFHSSMGSWIRFACVGDPYSPAPNQFNTTIFEWRAVKPGVRIGVLSPMP